MHSLKLFLFFQFGESLGDILHAELYFPKQKRTVLSAAFPPSGFVLTTQKTHAIHEQSSSKVCAAACSSPYFCLRDPSCM